MRHDAASRRLIPPQPPSILKVVCACACCGPLVAGCAALSRRPAPPPQYSNVHPPGFAPNVRWTGRMTQREFRRWAAAHLPAIVRSAHGGPVNMLVLSGGGGAGAFGAGVLAGWSRLGTRPSFAVVTGVSVGAFIAPFAFLGPKWDRQLTQAFDGTDAPSLFEPRLLGWLGALFGWSAFRGAPLRALVDRYATPAMLRAVAAQAATGRLLLVGTTDLDSGEFVVWNMGAIASQGGRRALRLFRQVLVASASIPGEFPPVLIRVQASHEIFDEMHVDGSASSAFLFAPGIISVLPVQIRPLHGANVYLIVNGHLRPPSKTIPNRTIAILRRSVGTELTGRSRARVKLIYSFALRQGMRLKVTEIPPSYRLGGLVGNLEPLSMAALFAYGKRCARERRVWADPFTVLNRIAWHRAKPPDKAARCPAPAPRGRIASLTRRLASERRLPLAGAAFRGRTSPSPRHQGGEPR